MYPDHSTNENFAVCNILDQQNQGLLAGTFEYPNGWKAEGGVFWNFQNVKNPVVCNAWTINPQKFEMFEFLPDERFSWTEPDMGMFGRGQRVDGVINLPPMPAVDTFTQMLIPKFRGNRQNLRIIAANAEPTTVKTPPQISPQNVIANKAIVKIEYVEENRMVEEEFHGTHVICQFPPMNGAFGTSYFIGWWVSELCSFRTEKGQLQNIRETFLRIKASFKMNPQWVDFANKTAQMMMQNSTQIGNDLINSGWERIRMNGEASQQFMQRNQDYVNQQQQRINSMYNTPPPSNNSNSSDSSYSSHDAFIDSVYERESIHNAENTANEKVSGYNDYIWKDEFGNVKTTNDPNFDPNVGSHINWTLAQKKRIGDS